jgi:hypothetical protein
MKRPTSFTLLALYLGWKALEGFLAALDPLSSSGPSLLTAVFAAVAAEALWRCRPWCVRATVGYFAASILAWLVTSVTADRVLPGELVPLTITRLILAALPVLYVSHRAKQIFAASPAPVAIPAPRP